MLTVEDKNLAPIIEIGSKQKQTIVTLANGYKAILEAKIHQENNSEIPTNFDDLVFANRNREYGAFVLRKGYITNVYFGMAVTLILLLFVLISPIIVELFRGNEINERPALKKLVYTELTAPPPIDKLKPPPAQIHLPKLQKVIKFVPPKVVKESITESAPTIQEIRDNETASVAVEGTEFVFEEPVEEVIEDDNELFTVVEQNPEFEGGYAAMMAFIQKNMVYPPIARRMQVDGTVHISFIVSKTGTISEVKVLRGISAECDKEAVRVVELMPPWKPGKQNGRPVNVRFVMPLKFRLR